MKNFLAILILVIGIVLLIPDKTLAADCDLTLSSAATSRYYCEDNDTMTITSDGSIERVWANIDAGHDSSNGTASTGVTINNAALYIQDKVMQEGLEKVLFILMKAPTAL